MGDRQIIGLGIATLDVLLRLHEMPTWASGGRLNGFALDGGGPAATAMAAAARLGAKTGFIGTAGNDDAADMKIRSLVRDGVDVSRVVVRDAPENQVAAVYVNKTDGERVFCSLERFGENQLRPDELDRQYITSADYLHLDGFHYDAALQAAQWMRMAGKTVVYDGTTSRGPISDHTRDLLEYVDVFICESGFCQRLTGHADPWHAARSALGMGPRIVVQTEGPDGSRTVSVNEQFHTPAFPVEVVDTTGAGDVFHGAYIVGLLHGWGLRTVAQFSSAVSALKCTRLGGRAGIPRYDEVRTFLREHGIRIE